MRFNQTRQCIRSLPLQARSGGPGPQTADFR